MSLSGSGATLSLVEAYLTVESGQHVGSSYSVAAGATVILGSAPDATIRLLDPGIAPQHAALRIELPLSFQVVDLAGGTTLNGEVLPSRVPTPAGSGDVLGVAGCELLIELVGVEATLTPARPTPLAEFFPSPDYEVLRQLGSGGMGRVLEARRRSDGFLVAVKVMNETLDPSSEEHQRFVVEGRLAQKVQSPHVVEVYEANVLPTGQAYIVMEHVPGPSLHLRVAQHGPLSIQEALLVGEHVANAIVAACLVGVVHRDIKPGNVLLHPQGVAKLTDFGIAKDLDSTLRSLTETGVGLGTLGYMAPEQLEAKYVDVGADIYGLGATLFFALCARAPLMIRDMSQIRMIADMAAPPLSQFRPDAPPALVELVKAMLESASWDRPMAVEVVDALRRLRGG
jgi:serine/threonine protein kinase